MVIVAGGRSVDPDDITRVATRNLGATDISYGLPVLPGSMSLVSYIKKVQSERAMTKSKEDSRLTARDPEFVPVLSASARALYHKTTVFDLLL